MRANTEIRRVQLRTSWQKIYKIARITEIKSFEGEIVAVGEMDMRPRDGC